jgi:hypothetical protein
MIMSPRAPLIAIASAKGRLLEIKKHILCHLDSGSDPC